MKIDYRGLADKLGYRFQSENLLVTALTHRSAGKQNNERLEFLGDSILNFVIAEYLYNSFPELREGEMSRLRASLVKGDRLAELAKDLSLSDYLILGTGELKSGGYRRGSILADALEAVIGAVYLDSNFHTAQTLILNLYADLLNDLDQYVDLKDPKTTLQEFLQSRSLPLPEYEVVEVSGEQHKQTFVVHCKVALLDQPIPGKGSSRRKAEQDAAKRVLGKVRNG